MNGTLSLQRNLLIFGIPLTLLGLLVLFIKYAFPTGNDTLALAFSIDLLFTIPLIYFLLIRQTTIPKTTVVPFMLVGLFLGLYLLPEESQTYLSLFQTWGLPVIELSVIAFIVWKVRRAVKKYDELKDQSVDFYTGLKRTCQEILPKKLVLPFATEVAVFYYGFLRWKSKQVKENEFTYHKESGAPALFGVLILIIGIETIVFHLLLGLWSDLAAWMLTALSLYTAIQVVGFARSLSQRPITIHDDTLYLRYGILNEAEIDLADISLIELSHKSLEKGPFTKTLSPLGELVSHNVILHLKNEYVLTGLYGIRRKFNVIGLHVDEPLKFQLYLNNSL
jgi:hypothetical protein